MPETTIANLDAQLLKVRARFIAAIERCDLEAANLLQGRLDTLLEQRYAMPQQRTGEGS